MANRWLVTRRLSSQMQPSFVTTPIFYVNAAPHIGHLYSSVIADAIHRFNKMTRSNKPDDCFLSTGTDEHGLKIQQAAIKHSTSTEDYCNAIASKYRELFGRFKIDYTRFIRTTDTDHRQAVHAFWRSLAASDSIYTANYSGWYCVPDETFLTDSQLKENERGEKCSIDSGHPVDWTEEENYMFRLGRYQDDVRYWVKGLEGRRIQPDKFARILLGYLEEPLPDISISRPMNRVSWGIPVPSDPSQSVYVWLDALVNYLTVAGYPKENFCTRWPPTVQVLGKDILKFHGIYWPAFLMAANLEPPQQLLVHSHWTVDNQKMSKSKHNVVDPNERAELFTHEGLRYFLLREGAAHSDGNYSDTKILRVLNSELADTLGNLLSRCCGKALNAASIFPAVDVDALEALKEVDATKRMLEALEEMPDKTLGHYKNYNFYLVADTVVHLLHTANNFFETTAPWKLKKSDNCADRAKLNTILSITMEVLRQAGIVTQPIVPGLSMQLLDKLQISHSARSWNDLKVRFSTRDTPLAEGECILFRRIVPPAPTANELDRPEKHSSLKKRKQSS
ncbi:methionine--tRNA ligase, mitochondrial [Anopheles marshallii]|uniref:methionine--tRNA ligase, mitochondrial n=1 Tax=Anopheles marshallii TaxID=1521116 RepID=UPI00237C46EA|nr:methionine--tRNA ligase, mitochondrial [Anopheles marshallii]